MNATNLITIPTLCYLESFDQSIIVQNFLSSYYLVDLLRGVVYTVKTVVKSFSFVTASPYFSVPSRVVSVKKGDTATLLCTVQGDTPINVRWLRGGKIQLTPATNYR